MRSRTRPSNRSAVALRLTAAGLAITAALSGTSALADHGRYRDGYRPYDRTYDKPFHATGRSEYRKSIRVHIPVRDHGPETLPLGRLIKQNSGLDMNNYRLVAVVVRNGRWSHGYASLRTGDRKSGRYFLEGGSKTRIPAPSRADRKWRLRLGPGTQVSSITAILEHRRQGRAREGRS